MSFVRLLESCIVMGVRLLHCESDGPFLCLAVLLQDISSLLSTIERCKFASRLS